MVALFMVSHKGKQAGHVLLSKSMHTQTWAFGYTQQQKGMAQWCMGHEYIPISGTGHGQPES